MSVARTRHAGDCKVCGTAIDQETLDSWCDSHPPFCWKCGSYYFVEGHHDGKTAEAARAKALAFDDRAVSTIRALIHPQPEGAQ